MGSDFSTSTPSDAEAPLEPALEICDAHHHLWNRAAEPYLVEDLLADLGGGHNVTVTVAVECGAMYRAEGPAALRPVGETEYLDAVASRVRGDSRVSTAVAAAIVGFADLALGDGVDDVLAAHLAASPRRFRGIRYSTTWDGSGALRNEAPRGMLADGMFRRGFERLRRRGLTFDAWLYHPQLSELADLARAFPDAAIVLDHVGAPLGTGPYAGKRNEVFAAWRGGIDCVAACPNVMVKLGGFGSERSGFDWHHRATRPGSAELCEAMRPYIEHCIERFGVQRCMFESNFPVEKRANGYSAVWNAFKRIAAGYSESERAALFFGTAARFYRPVFD